MWEIGDIVVVRSNTLLGRAIRWITRSWASHVCVFVGDGLFFEARPSRAGYASVTRYMTPDYEWRIYRLKVDESWRSLFVENLVRKEGRKYDFLQILWLLVVSLGGLRSRISTKTSANRAICSEIVFEALEESGIKLGLKQSNVVPGDFEKFDILERVY